MKQDISGEIPKKWIAYEDRNRIYIGGNEVGDSKELAELVRQPFDSFVSASSFRNCETVCDWPFEIPQNAVTSLFETHDLPSVQDCQWIVLTTPRNFKEAKITIMCFGADDKKGVVIKFRKNEKYPFVYPEPISQNSNATFQAVWPARLVIGTTLRDWYFCVEEFVTCSKEKVVLKSLEDVREVASQIQKGFQLSGYPGYKHGDFTFWNLRWSGNRILVLDWEQVSEGDINDDMLKYVLSTNSLKHALDYGMYVKGSKEILKRERNKIFSRILEQPDFWAKKVLLVRITKLCFILAISTAYPLLLKCSLRPNG